MKIERFEDIISWQKTRELNQFIYKEFQFTRDFAFKDQIQRAGVSIMNNIAEGFERKGNKEFTKYLFIAKGSCAEVRSMLYLSLDLKYLKQPVFTELYTRTIEISRLLSGLIKSLRT